MPDWWEPSCAKQPSLLPDLEVRVARFLGVPLEDIRQPAKALATPEYPQARLRRVKDVDKDRMGPAIHAGLAVAGALLRSLRMPLPPVELPPTDALAWRKQLQAGDGPVGLDTLAGDLWRRGIPVVHLDVLPSPRFQGLACIVAGRPIIFLGHRNDEPARLAIFLGHEAGHVVHGDCEEGAPVVDEEDVAATSDMERRAEQYSWHVLAGTAHLGGVRASGFKELAAKAVALGKDQGIDPAMIVWSWGNRTQDFQTAQMALKALYRHTGGSRLLRQHFDAHVDIGVASESDRALLRCVQGDPDRDAVSG